MSRTNPDTRPLPAGWIEVYDEQRNVWFYNNISVNPYRTSYVHPLGPEAAYATTQLTSRPQAGSNLSFAQQLYASSLSSMPREPVEARAPSPPDALSLPPPPSSVAREETAAVHIDSHQQRTPNDNDTFDQTISVRRDAYIRPPPEIDYYSPPPHQQHDSEASDHVAQVTSLRREFPSNYSQAASEPEPATLSAQWTTSSEYPDDEADSELAYLTSAPGPQRQPTLPWYSEPSSSDIPEADAVLSRPDDSSARQAHSRVPSYSGQPPNISPPSPVIAPSLPPIPVTEEFASQRLPYTPRQPSGARTSSERRVSGPRRVPSSTASVRTFSSGSSSQSTSPTPSFYSFSQSPHLGAQGSRNVTTVASLAPESPITPLSAVSTPPPPPPPNKPTEMGPPPVHPSRVIPSTPLSARPPAGFHRPSEPTIAHPVLPPPQLPPRSQSAQASVGGFDPRINSQFAPPPPHGSSGPPPPPPRIITYSASAGPPTIPQSPPIPQQGPQPLLSYNPNQPPASTSAPAPAPAPPAPHQRGIIDTITHNHTIRNGLIGVSVGLVGAAVLNTLVNGDPTQSVLSGDTISNAISGVTNLVDGGGGGGGGGGGILSNVLNGDSSGQSSQPDNSSMFYGNQPDPSSFDASNYSPPPSQSAYDPSSFGNAGYSPPPSSAGYDPSSFGAPNYSPPPSPSYNPSSLGTTNYSPPPSPPTFDPSSYTTLNSSPPPSSPSYDLSSSGTSNNQSSSSSGHDYQHMVAQVLKIQKHEQQEQANALQHQMQNMLNDQAKLEQENQQRLQAQLAQLQEAQAQLNHRLYAEMPTQSNPQQYLATFQKIQQEQAQQKLQLEAELAKIQQQAYANALSSINSGNSAAVAGGGLAGLGASHLVPQMNSGGHVSNGNNYSQQQQYPPPNPSGSMPTNYGFPQASSQTNLGGHPSAVNYSQQTSTSTSNAPVNYAGGLNGGFHHGPGHPPAPPAHHSTHLGHSPNHHQPHLGVYAAHQAHHAHHTPNFSGPYSMHPPPHHQQPSHLPQAQKPHHHGLSPGMQAKLGEYAVKGIFKLGGMAISNPFNNGGT